MIKKEFRYFTIGDYEDEELWLREHHRNGWKMVHFTHPGFYTFESCEPEDVIYRLDYKNKTQSPEYMQMLKDFGWEYIGECVGWLYFRKPAQTAEAEEDGELFSENASRAEMVSRIVRTRLIPLGVIFLCCVVPNVLRAGSEGWSVLRIFFIVMFVLYVYLLIHCGVKLKRIRSRYEQ